MVLPKEELSRLKLDKGDRLYLTETPDGYRLTPYEPVFETQMTTAGKIMKNRRAARRLVTNPLTQRPHQKNRALAWRARTGDRQMRVRSRLQQCA